MNNYVRLQLDMPKEHTRIISASTVKKYENKPITTNKVIFHTYSLNNFFVNIFKINNIN